MVNMIVNISTEENYIKYIVYDANNNPIYICEAIPGSPKADPIWRIKKITYDANNNPTDIQFGNGNTNFDKIANNYASYNYS